MSLTDDHPNIMHHDRHGLRTVLTEGGTEMMMTNDVPALSIEDLDMVNGGQEVFMHSWCREPDHGLEAIRTQLRPGRFDCSRRDQLEPDRQ